MRYAVISDIHANLEALDAVLRHIRQLGADQILCCGDILGYYTDPNDCMELLKANKVRAITGNHDLAAIGEKDLSTFWSVARKAIEWTRPRLSDAHRFDLLHMPKTIQQDDFLLFHGALHIEHNPEDYHLTSDEDILETMNALVSREPSARIAFCGHTHRPFGYERRRGALKRLTTTDVCINDDSHYLFNPGSVGQSRDKDERASYLLYDNVLRMVKFHRVEYDRKMTLRKAKSEHLLPDPRLVKHMKNAVRKAARLCGMQLQ